MAVRDSVINALKLRSDRVYESLDETLAGNLSIFFDLLHSETILNAIIIDLERPVLPDFKEIKSTIVQRQGFIFPKNQREKTRVCLSAIKYIIDDNELPWSVVSEASYHENVDEMTHEFITHFFTPFYSYILEKISNCDDLLYNLIRLKAYSEWYKKEFLYNLYQRNTKIGEAELDQVSREFLFHSGIDYPFSSPLSPDGRTDILVLIKEKPLPIEIKLFKGDNQAHIKQGFNQALKYANDYNSETGFLIIYNTDMKNLVLTLKLNDYPQRIQASGKTIYLIIIDIYPHPDPASKRKQETIEITEDYFLAK